VGSKCIKSSDFGKQNFGGTYGIFAGGLSSGYNNDSSPVEALLDLDGTYGNTCSFGLDCGICNKYFILWCLC